MRLFPVLFAHTLPPTGLLSSAPAGAVAPSPSAIAAALIPFSLGFPAMAALVADLQRRPVGGGQLLVMLHERTRGAGGSERQRLFERLLWHCYQARGPQRSSMSAARLCNALFAPCGSSLRN